MQLSFKSDVDWNEWNNINPIKTAHAYGCKREIIFYLLRKIHEEDVKSLCSVYLRQCTCYNEIGQNFNLCEWTKF